MKFEEAVEFSRDSIIELAVCSGFALVFIGLAYAFQEIYSDKYPVFILTIALIILFFKMALVSVFKMIILLAEKLRRHL